MAGRHISLPEANRKAVEWLLKSKDPSVRYFTLTDVLDEPENSARVRAAKSRILGGPKVRILMARQKADGGFGVHPYQKWTGAHWRLVSLVELGTPPGNKQAVAAANQVLHWLWGDSHRGSIKKIRGLTRRCASQEGNALAACSRLGLAGDQRVRGLAESLLSWQWPDGGWNCDRRPEASESSFYETLAPLWGLIEFHRATRDRSILQAATRAAEVFLRHKMFRSERTGEIIDQKWLALHYPLYWHYDVLQALRILSLLGKVRDHRAKEALDVIEAKRGTDGFWRPGGYYWLPYGKRKSNADIVDWGREGPNEMITLNALRVLKAARRLH